MSADRFLGLDGFFNRDDVHTDACAPGGTMAVMCSSGRNVIRSKKAVTSGWSAICCLFMLKNSALPGTNIGRMYCFSRWGFSQLYSSRPTTAICCKSGSSSPAGLPVLDQLGQGHGLADLHF